VPDVIIIGGGVIGLSIACELAGEGVSVAVLDQGQVGQESSWAGAGILPPGNPALARTPEARLRAASHVLWPELSARLKAETGIDNGFYRSGGLEVRIDGSDSALDDEAALWRTEGVALQPLANRDVWEFERELSPQIASAYRLPEMGQVRNPRHLKALVALALKRGVSLLPGVIVCGFDRQQEKVVAVETSSGKMPAGQFVVAGGAWSGRLLAEVGCHAAVRPLRGQIVLLATQPSPIRHVVNVGPRYLVPRGDGRVLVGATEEAAGFDKRTTACGVGGLMDFAIGLVPALARATFERSWAGLRPQSADGLPYLGRVSQANNLYVATGHFRAGLQLSPVTGLVMSQLLLGRESTVPLAPYSPERHHAVPEFSTTSRH
jgi:glycine oxidase